ACGSLPRARTSSSRPAPPTPTAIRIFPSSRPWGIRSQSTLIASSGGWREIAAGRYSSSAAAPTHTRAGASLLHLSPPVRWAPRRSSPSGSVDADEGLSRLRALGFSEADAQELWEHFDSAEQRGKQGHGHARIPWLEGLEGYHPTA